MGKGFQNFMSKKDFHPSAWWNLKKKWECEQKKELEEKRQNELRVQYEKEQDILNNKALLGDEKARIGLSFMYDAPAGINKKKEEGPEPKFEWQRKYNAPREEWAKGNELIQDQPFGIQVRNVRCVKCRTWGHLNTDRECPLFGMSGNADNHGYANNPSDLIRQLEAQKTLEAEHKALDADMKPGTSSDVKPTREDFRRSEKKIKNEENGQSSKSRKRKVSESSVEEAEQEEWAEVEDVKAAPMDQEQLLEDMREEHNLRFKTGVLMGLQADEGIRKLTNTIEEGEGKSNDFENFLKGLSDKKRKKILKKIMSETGGASTSKSSSSKKSKKDKKEKKHKKYKKHKKEKDGERRRRRSRS